MWDFKEIFRHIEAIEGGSNLFFFPWNYPICIRQLFGLIPRCKLDTKNWVKQRKITFLGNI